MDHLLQSNPCLPKLTCLDLLRLLGSLLLLRGSLLRLALGDGGATVLASADRSDGEAGKAISRYHLEGVDHVRVVLPPLTSLLDDSDLGLLDLISIATLYDEHTLLRYVDRSATFFSHKGDHGERDHTIGCIHLLLELVKLLQHELFLRRLLLFLIDGHFHSLGVFGLRNCSSLPFFPRNDGLIHALVIAVHISLAELLCEAPVALLALRKHHAEIQGYGP